MAKARSLVGLDVHATKIVAAVLDADTGELQFFTLNGETAGAVAFCEQLPRPVRVAYEAGPTGYVLARELIKRGVECVVAAPSKIPRGAGERVKTDRRDAENLVRLLWAGRLHPARIPGPEEEALRDLVRARESVRMDLMRARHRLSKLLLRHGHRFDDGNAWTEPHRQWLATIELGFPAAQLTLLDCRGAIDALMLRRDSLEREIVTILPDRQQDQPPAAVAIAWKAQLRLHRTWARMEARNKRRTLIAVAAARELAGFCWAITQIE